MTLQQLEYIVALDKYKHFVKAAESCGITQSTLSLMIHKLEEELDVAIFDRNRHPITATKVGEQIIKQAQLVLFHSKQLLDISSIERDKIEGEIHLGLTPTTAPYIVPKLFNYLKDYPNISFNATELYREESIAMLKNAEIDMVVMSYPKKDNDLLEIPLYKETLWAYVSPKDPLYNEDKISYKTMPRERLWALKSKISFQKQVSSICNIKSQRLAKYESGSISTLLRIVDENDGFTIIPELHIPLIDENAKKNLRPIIDPPLARQISIFIRKDYVCNSLLNIIIDGFKNIIPQHMLNDRLKKYQIKI